MFLNGWALILGAGALALPVLVHWLTRPRPVVWPVSTLRFIRGALQQRRARHRLRDILVLLLRTAAIALLACAIARPLMRQKARTMASVPQSLTRIVMLDCSQSMGAQSSGIAHFERARPLAAESLKFRPGMRCNLVLAAAAATPVFDTPSTNLGALREALSRAQVQPQRLRAQDAVNRIAESLAGSAPDVPLEVVIISDFQRSNWSAVDFSVLPASCSIQLQAVTTEEQCPNLAVVGAHPGGRVEAGKDSDFVIQVANFSDAPRHVRLELSIGRAVYPFEGQCPARSRSSFGGRIPFPQAGWQSGEVRLVGADDSLSQDDRLPVVVHVHEPPRLVVLTRDRPDRIPSAAYFLEGALSPESERNERLTRLDAADPDPESLRSADALLLVRPGRLSNNTLVQLAAMLQRGKGVLYVLSDPLDLSNLKDLLEALGSSVRPPETFLAQPSERLGSKRVVAQVDQRRPPFSVFGDELGAALHSLEFSDGLISRPAPDGLPDDVRARFSDQSAFLIVSSAGRGKLALLNVDLERSNLARTPVLVPLLGELLSSELAAGDTQDKSFASGEALIVPVPVGEERVSELRVQGPLEGQSAEGARGDFHSSSTGVVWESTASGPPGVYRVDLAGTTVAAAVTTIPAEESDLRVLPSQVFEGRLAGGRQLDFQSGEALQPDAQDGGWVWLAAGCLMCLLGELVTLRVFHG